MSEKIEAYPPDSHRRLVACIDCKLIQTTEQFLKERRCPNCCGNTISDYESLRELTTTNFSGMISLMQPSSSWVGRWNGLRGCKAGVYAIDARAEVSLYRDDNARYEDDYESDGSEIERDEREVNVKREQLHARN